MLEEQDVISQYIGFYCSSPCENCSEKAECNFENKAKQCEKRIDIRLKAERIA